MYVTLSDENKEERENGERKRRLLFLAKRAEKLLGKYAQYLRHCACNLLLGTPSHIPISIPTTHLTYSVYPTPLTPIKNMPHPFRIVRDHGLDGTALTAEEKTLDPIPDTAHCTGWSYNR